MPGKEERVKFEGVCRKKRAGSRAQHGGPHQPDGPSGAMLSENGALPFEYALTLFAERKV